MPPNINFSNIKPCDQYWDEMPECKDGRLCLKCQETITDFRGKTDWEIAVIHANSSKKVCGIYDKKTLATRPNETENTHPLLIASLVGFLGISPNIKNLDTNEVKSVYPTIELSSTDIIPKETNLSKVITEHLDKDSLRIIKGTVLSEYDERPVTGCTVLVLGTFFGTSTDMFGKFSLNLTEEFLARDSVTLVFHYIGFDRKEITLIKKDISPSYEMQMILNESLTLTNFSIRERLPWHKRVWNAIIGVFRKDH